MNTCPDCEGQGVNVYNGVCESCDGTGMVDDKFDYSEHFFGQ